MEKKNLLMEQFMKEIGLTIKPMAKVLKIKYITNFYRKKLLKLEFLEI